MKPALVYRSYNLFKNQCFFSIFFSFSAHGTERSCNAFCVCSWDSSKDRCIRKKYCKNVLSMESCEELLECKFVDGQCGNRPCYELTEDLCLDAYACDYSDESMACFTNNCTTHDDEDCENAFGCWWDNLDLNCLQVIKPKQICMIFNEIAC